MLKASRSVQELKVAKREKTTQQGLSLYPGSLPDLLAIPLQGSLGWGWGAKGGLGEGSLNSCLSVGGRQDK